MKVKDRVHLGHFALKIIRSLKPRGTKDDFYT